LVITAPAIIAIMTILARDATAGVGGLTGVVDWPLTAFSFGVRSVGCLRRHAAIQDSGANVTRLHFQRESLTIKNHPSNI
jgi:hypothetical protein